MKIAGGLVQDGIVIGNTYDKYGSRNSVVRLIVDGFDDALGVLVDKAKPATIHEMGCGEGYWVFKWRKRGIDARGTDFSSEVIEMAQTNADKYGAPSHVFETRSIYDVRADRDGADLIVCCEVLEHLEEPRRALEALRNVVSGYLILSVPREPLWRLLNFARGKYLTDFGNTPGHLQHWSKRGFVALIGEYFDVLEVRQPFPWTMLLCQPKVKR